MQVSQCYRRSFIFIPLQGLDFMTSPNIFGPVNHSSDPSVAMQVPKVPAQDVESNLTVASSS